VIRALAKTSRKGRPRDSGNIWERLKEVDRFFQERDDVHKTLRRVIRRLEKAKIPYALMGGMAVFFQGHRRQTNDVDILLSQKGLDHFQKLYVPKNYTTIPGRNRRFVDRVNNVTIDFLITGRFPGSGKPGPIAFPDPKAVQKRIQNLKVINLPTLIQLKLAARRYQDFADVVSLIRVRNLDETFLSQLHPSVQGDFLECLEEKRREEEYEARQDQNLRAMTKEDGYDIDET
jgi:hypothetical protein